MTRGRVVVAALLLVGLAIPSGRARARSLAGHEFEETTVREGRTLHLTGLGMREKYFFDVYVLGAWTESGACDPDRMVRDDETKLLRLTFVRSVPAKRMRKEVRSMVESRIPADADEAGRQQSEAFVAIFDQDVSDGAVFEMLYVPGAGTRVTRDGKPQGATLVGKPFQEVLWSTYMGAEPCCPKTKKQLLQSCAGK